MPATFRDRKLTYHGRVTVRLIFSPSFTCNPHELPYLPLLLSREASLPLADTHCTFLRKDSQAELTWVAGYNLHSDIDIRHRELNQDTVTHPISSFSICLSNVTRIASSMTDIWLLSTRIWLRNAYLGQFWGFSSGDFDP